MPSPPWPRSATPPTCRGAGRPSGATSAPTPLPGPPTTPHLLLRAGHTHPTTILVDQGDSDQFLADQLHPDALSDAATAAGQALSLRHHPGYDHSYWFIQTVIGDHVAHHARILG